MEKWYQHEVGFEGESENEGEGEAESEFGGRRALGSRAPTRFSGASRSRQRFPGAASRPRSFPQGGKDMPVRGRERRWPWLIYSPTTPFWAGGILRYEPVDPTLIEEPPPAPRQDSAPPETPDTNTPINGSAPVSSPEGDEEFEATRYLAKPPGTVTKLTLSWRRAKLDRFESGSKLNLPDGGGLYLVTPTGEDSALPFYVGETGSFRTRLWKRLQPAYQIGLIDAGPLARPVHLWLGTISASDAKALSAKQIEYTRATVEWAAIRTLLRGGVALRNTSSVRPFKTGEQFLIDNLLPGKVPSKLQAGKLGGYTPATNRLSLVSGTSYELAFP